jgi:hypothetical protein
MRNDDATDGYTAGYQHPVLGTDGKRIRIPNGTVVGIKWQFVAGNGTIALARPFSTGDVTTRTAVGGEAVATGSSVMFCPSAVITDAFGDYYGTDAGQICVIERVVGGGQRTFRTFLGGQWADRVYDLKQLRPQRGVYVMDVLPIRFFGPQRNTQPCDWYVVGLASGLSDKGEGALWQIRHQSSTNRLRYEAVGRGEDVRLPEIDDRLEREDGWLFLIDPDQRMIYDEPTQSMYVAVTVVNPNGNTRKPFVNGYQIQPGTSIHVTYKVNVRLNFGDNCNAVHTSRTIDCGAIVSVPKKGAIVRCDDARPVAGGGPTIYDDESVMLPMDSPTIAVYPNPTDGLTSVELNGAEIDPSMIMITDATGRPVDIPVQSDANALLLDASGLPAGLYIIRLVSERAAVTSTFVVRSR